MSWGFVLMPWLHWAQLTNFVPFDTRLRDSANATSGLWLEPMGSLVKQFPCFLLFLNFSCSTETTSVTIPWITQRKPTPRRGDLVTWKAITHGIVQKFLMEVSDMARWYAGTANFPQLSHFKRAPVKRRKKNRICLYPRDELTFPSGTLAVFSYPRRWQSGPWMPSHNCCCRRSWRIHLRFCCGPSLPGSETCDTSCKAPAPWFSFGFKSRERIQTGQTWKKNLLMSNPGGFPTCLYFSKHSTLHRVLVLPSIFSSSGFMWQ